MFGLQGGTAGFQHSTRRAGSGIGKAVCHVFAREGARLALADVDASTAEKTMQEIKGDNHYVFEMDVALSTSVQELFSNIKETCSQVPSIAVNCAGITKDNFLLKMDEQSFDDVIAVNLKGTYLLGQAVARALVENKEPSGAIVNISSIVSKVGHKGQSSYTASKAGVIALSKTMAKELAQHGIRVNVVLPGFIATPMVKTMPEKVADGLIKQIPMGRMGQPEEVAEACLFLVSDHSRYVTGACLEVTGGLFM